MNEKPDLLADENILEVQVLDHRLLQAVLEEYNT